MTRKRAEYIIPVEDDGLFAPKVGEWSEDKYRRVGMYAEMFSTAMKNSWPTRVYLDLFAGPGHALIGNPPRRVMTSPLLALRVPDPFSKYIFADRDPKLVQALRQRVERIRPDADVEYRVGDVNQMADEIGSLIPSHSKSRRVISFCFVDPFAMNIDFATIRTLGAKRAMDFLILLALGMDANRNWASYVAPSNQTVDRFLGDVSWRVRWKVAEGDGMSRIRFLAAEYARSMTSLGYKTTSIDQMMEVKTYDNNMRLYCLAFFSRNQKGYDFWCGVHVFDRSAWADVLMVRRVSACLDQSLRAIAHCMIGSRRKRKT